MVPEGHTIQVHPPGAISQPSLQPQGMMPNPATDGAKAAMDAVLPAPKPKIKKKATAGTKPEGKKA